MQTDRDFRSELDALDETPTVRDDTAPAPAWPTTGPISETRRAVEPMIDRFAITKQIEDEEKREAARQGSSPLWTEAPRAIATMGLAPYVAAKYFGRGEDGEGILGTLGKLDEGERQQWIADEKVSAERSASFWEGLRKNYGDAIKRGLGTVLDYSPQGLIAQQALKRTGVIGDDAALSDEFGGWFDRKVGENIALAKRRRLLAEEMEAGVRAAPKFGALRSSFDDIQRSMAGIIGKGVKGVGYGIESGDLIKINPLVDGIIVDTLKKAGVISGNPSEAQNRYIYQFGQYIEHQAEQMFPEDQARAEEFRKKLSEGVGSMIAFMGAGYTAVALGKGAGVATLMSGLTGGMSQAGSMTDDALKKYLKDAGTEGRKLTPEEERKATQVWLMALGIGATEAVPLASFFAGHSGRFVRGVLLQATEEGGQEWVQQVLENVIAQRYYDPDRKWDDNAWEGLAIGAILGSHMQAGQSGLAKLRGEKDEPPPGTKPPPVKPTASEGPSPDPLLMGDVSPMLDGEGDGKKPTVRKTKSADPELDRLRQILTLSTVEDERPTEARRVLGKGLEELAAEGGPGDAIAKVAGVVSKKLETGEVPTFAEMLSALPKDERGDPDMGRLADELDKVGVRAWNALNDDQRRQVYEAVAPVVEQVAPLVQEAITALAPSGTETKGPSQPDVSLPAARRAEIDALADKVVRERGAYRALLHAQAAEVDATTPERRAEMAYYQQSLRRYDTETDQLKTAQPAPAAAPPAPVSTADLRTAFDRVLASRTKRADWAKTIGASKEQLDALVNEALADGRLKKTKAGGIARTGKKVSPPAPTTGQTTGQVSAQPVDRPQEQPAEKPATRTMDRSAEKRLEAVKSDVARTYAQQLLEAPATEYMKLVTKLSKDKKAPVAVVHEVATVVTGSKGKTKQDSLNKLAEAKPAVEVAPEPAVVGSRLIPFTPGTPEKGLPSFIRRDRDMESSAVYADYAPGTTVEEYQILDGKKVVGKVQLERRTDGTFSLHPKIDPAYQRKGIGRKVYDAFIAHEKNLTLVPSDDLSASSLALWRKLRPEAVATHKLNSEASELAGEPTYIREGTEDKFATRVMTAFAEALNQVDVPRQQPETPTAQAAVEAFIEKKARIEDAGQKIGGARKDMWAERGIALADLEGMSNGEQAKYVNKDGVWPKPDYAALVEAGMPPVVAATLKLIRDGLSARPRYDTPDGRRAYVEMMGWVRSEFEKVRSIEDFSAARDRVIYDLVGWPRGTFERGTAEQSAKLFSIFKGRKEALRPDGNMVRKAQKMVSAGFPGDVEPWTRRFDVRRWPRPDRPENYMVLNKQGRMQSEHPTEAEAKAAAKALYEAQKETDADEGKLPERPHLDNLTRTGADIRGGRDVDSNDFVKDFGFRGVEFGNWVAGDERQKVVNLAYDAMHDLANVLGIPVRALSLNGTLGLAFGARGSGRFAAHYEPAKLVINMTKIRGAGSLAHEWAHALDHYFGELGRTDAYQGDARGASGWYEQAKSYSGQPITRYDRQRGTVSEMRLSSIRPEMSVAFDGVMDALYKRDRTQADVVRDRELALERARGNVTTTEQRLKTFEAADAKSQERNAKYGESLREYLKGAKDRVALLEKALTEARGPDFKPSGKVDSSFYTQAKALSGKQGEKGYWARPTEMFARSLESYVFDKIAEGGAQSDYLVQGVEPERYAGSEYKGNPYPAGPERDAINAAYDRLFDTMESTPEGALYALTPPMHAITEDRARKAVRSALKLGKAVRLNDDTRTAMQSVMARMPNILPSDTTTGFLVEVRPLKSGNIRAFFETADGSLVHFDGTADDFLGSRAFFVKAKDGPAIFHVRFSTPGEDGVASLTSERWHEAIHALRAAEALAGPTWDLLLSHANSLRILEMSWKSYLQAAGDPAAENANPNATLIELYYTTYSKRMTKAQLQEALDQEAVAIMTELLVRGVDLPLPENIRSILAEIERGEFAGSAGIAAPGMVLAALARDNEGAPSTPGLDMSREARLERAREMGFDTRKVWYHGSKSVVDAFDLRKAGRSDPGLVGRAAYFTPEAEQAGSFALSPHYGRGESPNVTPVYLRMSNPAIVIDGVLPDGRRLTEAHPRGITKDSAAALKRDLMAAGYDSVLFQTQDGEVTQAATFNPSNIRSVNAAFDPAHSDSPQLLAALGGNISPADFAAPQQAARQALAQASAAIANDEANVAFRSKTLQVAGFVQDWVVPSEGQSVTATSLYEAYSEWVEALKGEPVPLPTFTSALNDLGLTKQKIAGRVRYIGVNVLPEGERPAPTSAPTPRPDVSQANAREIAADIRKGSSVLDAIKGLISRLTSLVRSKTDPVAAERLVHARALEKAVANENDPNGRIIKNVVPLFALGGGTIFSKETQEAKTLSRHFGATRIEDIGPNDPHPGRVLAFHGTEYDFDRFDVGRSQALGVHFGTAEHANARADERVGVTEGGRVIPAVIDAPNTLDLPDLHTWEPLTIARAVADRVDALADLPDLVEDKGELADDIIRDRLTQAGIDAIRYRNETEGPGWSYIVWEPGKVISATSGNMLFALGGGISNDADIDSSTGQSMRRDLDSLGFYSKALEAAKALKQEKGTPEQMLAQLKKAGVKDAEIEATGLDKLFSEIGKPRDPNTPPLGAQREGVQSRLDQNARPIVAVPSSETVPAYVDAVVSTLQSRGWNLDARSQSGLSASTYLKFVKADGSLLRISKKGRSIWLSEFKAGGAPADGYLNVRVSDHRGYGGATTPQADVRLGQTLDDLAARADRLLELEAEYPAGGSREAGSTTALESDAITLSQNPQQQGDRTASPPRRALLKQITKAEIVKHLEQNRVGLREVSYGGRADLNKSSIDVDATADELGQALIDSGVSQARLSELLEEIGYLSDTPGSRLPDAPEYRDPRIRRLAQAALDAAHEAPEDFTERAPKWANYSLDPSNPTYRETVIHLPVDMPDREAAQARVTALQSAVNEPGISFEEMLSRRRAADAAASEMSAASSSALKARQEAFQSGHFPEPNIIGHLMTSMTRHEGKAVYTIDQIQSDWGQKLRDGGVRDEKKIAALEAQWAAAEKKYLDEVSAKFPGLDPRRVRNGDIEDAGIDRTEVQRIRAELQTAKASSPGHPLVNTTDQWTQTTLRRAIRQAVEAGAEYIAIPHGDTVLSYNPGGEDGMRGFYGKPRATPERISELKEDLVEQEAEAEAATGVRRENAERRIEAIKKQIASAESVVEGIVPKNLRKLLSTLDKDSPAPVKVKTVEATDGPRGWNRKEEYPFDKSQTGFTLFPLADKVRQSVLEEGQPMFALGGFRPDPEDSAAPSLNKVIQTLKDTVGVVPTQTLLGVTIKAGDQEFRLNPRSNVAGQTMMPTGAVGTRKSRHLEAIAHETAHYLETTLGAEILDLQRDHQADLMQFYDARPDQPYSAPEAFAEFFRTYLTNPSGAQSLAPELVSAFEDVLEANGMLDGINDTQALYQDWLARATPEELASDVVSVHAGNSWTELKADRAFENIPGKMATAYTNTIDDLNPLQKIVRKLLETADRNGVVDEEGRPISLKVAENPYKIARMFRGSYGTGYSWLTKGIANRGERAIAYRPLSKALETLFGSSSKKDWDPAMYQTAGQYLISKRALAEYERLEQKEERLGQIDDLIEQGGQAWRQLSLEDQSTRTTLERREAALIRSRALLVDRRNALKSAESNLSRIQERIETKKDDVLAAQMARDQALADRRRRDLAILERDSQRALRETQGLIEEFDTLSTDVAMLTAEIDQLRERGDGVRGQLAGVDEAMTGLRREREATEKRGASRAPTKEPKSWHADFIAKTEADPKYKRIKDFAALVYEFSHGMLNLKHQHGLISDDLFNELSKRKDWYVPFQRDMTDASPEDVFFRGAGIEKWSPIKKFDGSDRAIINPLETMAADAYTLAQQIAFNSATDALARLAERAGPGSASIAQVLTREESAEANAATFDRVKNIAMSMGIDEADALRIVTELEQNFAGSELSLLWSPATKGPVNLPTVPLYRNGERILVRFTDPEFGMQAYNAFSGMGKETAGLISELLGYPSRLLQQGVTTHPTFIPRNLFRDIFDAWIKTGALPIVTQFRGVAAMKDPNFFRGYLEAGGITGGRNLSALTSKEKQVEVLDLADKAISKGNITLGSIAGGLLGAVAGGPLAIVPAAAAGAYLFNRFGALETVESVETMTRLGVAAHAFKRAKQHNPNLTDTEAMLEAAFVARDVFDWNRRGSKMIAIVRTITFLNAQLQGMDSAYRRVGGENDRGMVVSKHMGMVWRRENGGVLSADEQRALGDAYKTWARMALYTGMLLGLYALATSGGDDDDRDKAYQDIKDRTKSTHSWLPQVFGTDLRLPKAFEWALPANAIEAIADKIRGRDPHAWDRIVDSMYEIAVPPTVPQGLNLIMGLTADVQIEQLTPWVKRLLGREVENTKPRQVVADALKKLDPEAQFDAWSSQLSIDVAKAMAAAGVPRDLVPSPKKIDFILRTGGYWGQDVQRGYQVLKEAFGGRQREAPRISDLPVIAGFTGVAARQSRSRDEMYQLMSQSGGQLKTAAETYKNLLAEQGVPAEAAVYLSKLEPEERVYAILAYHGSPNDKRTHPLERLLQVDGVANKIRKDIILDRLAPIEKQGRRNVRNFEEKINLTPRQQTQMHEIFERLQQAEAWNSMILMNRPGWQGKKEIAVEPILAELRAANPEVADLYDERLTKTKARSWDEVKSGWPDLRERILRDGVDAF